MMPRRLWIAVALWLTGGCLSSNTPDQTSETHWVNGWLRACDSDTPCGEPYECVCGHCTLTCDGPGACDSLPGAACAEASLMPVDGICPADEPEVLACIPVGDAGSASNSLVSTFSSWFDGDPVVGTAYRAHVLELDEEGNLRRTGKQLVSDPETGNVVLDPSFEEESLAFHIVGASYTVDDAREPIVFETYDSIVLNFSWARGDRRLRVPLVEMAEFEQAIAQVEPRTDRAAMTGHVYWGPGNEIEGSVGCAQLYLDDDTSGADRDADQRYLADNRLPTTLEELSQTGRGGGFYFGNLAPGDHRLRVTLDGGDTFIAKSHVKVTLTRGDSLGPFTMMLYQFDIHVDATSDPTPENCPR